MGVKVMGVVTWIVLGLITGIVAKWVMPGPRGWLTPLMLGVIGATVGGFVGIGAGFGGVNDLKIGSLLLAILGSILLLSGYHTIAKRREL
jgi:uncharacterized membrane protein YeaQ/YmgE (transglycosylase-associated protein family)